MAIQHMDNFSLYGIGSGSQALMRDGMYAQVGTFTSWVVADPDPNVVNGSAFRMGVNPSGFEGFRLILSSAQNIVGVAQRVWLSQIPGDPRAAPMFIDFRTGANASILQAWINPTGGISIGAVGAVVASTPGPVITPNGWWHIETMIDCSTGDVEIRVNGVPKLVYPGSGSFSPVAQVQVLNKDWTANTTPNMYIKDFIVWDGSGTRNNSFVGSRSVFNLVPNADVNLNWALQGGVNGFSILAVRPPVDANYIYAVDPAPAPYVGDMTDLPTDVTTVSAIMAVTRSRKTDGGDANLQVGIISGSDTALGEDRPLNTAFTYFKDIFEVDPATDDTWSPSAVNAAQLQLNRTV